MLSKNELTARWWQHFLNHINDDNVYFVDGKMLTFNDKRTHKTEQIIERDKTIVIPVDNWISLAKSHFYIPPKKYEETLKTLAVERMNRVSKLSLSIDDTEQAVTPRIISPVFDVMINESSKETLHELEVPTALDNGKYKALSDGYWLFIEPNTLSPGPHEIKTYGNCATGLLELEIHHLIHII